MTEKERRNAFELMIEMKDVPVALPMDKLIDEIWLLLKNASSNQEKEKIKEKIIWAIKSAIMQNQLTK